MAARAVLLVLCWFIVVLGCNAVDISPSSFLSRDLLGRQFPSGPGLTLSLKPAPTVFAPQNSAYLESLLLVALPGIALAVGSLVAGVLFVLLRSFGLCGGWSAKPEGYSLPEARITRVVLVFAVGAVGIACFTGYTGNNLFSVGVDDFFGEITDTAELIASFGRYVYDKILLVQTDFSGKQDLIKNLKVFRSLTDDIRSGARDAQDVASGITSMRWMALFFCFELAIIAGAVGITGVIYRQGIPSLFMGLMGFLVLFFTWLMWSIHFPLGIALNDFCDAVDKFADDPQSGSGVEYFVSCLNQDKFDKDLQDTYNAFEEFSEKMDYLAKLYPSCTSETRIIQSPVPLDDQQSLVSGLGSAVSNATTMNSEFQACGSANSTDKDAMEVLVSDLEIISGILTRMSKLINCNLLRDLFRSLRDSLCGKLLTSLNLIQGSSYATGIGMTVAVIFGIRGFKRLSPVNAKRIHKCPVHGCNRYFRFQFMQKMHLQFCRRRHLAGLFVGFYVSPFLTYAKNSARARKNAVLGMKKTVRELNEARKARAKSSGSDSTDVSEVHLGE